ncbi:hypothetical protein [Acinetobacter terrae]|uniref:Uncharacterized protein n=1 Tax=Acinetobacter terrae TaxID=2731247 RepID=A0ABX1UZ79_9GAMM|nr:hypothetical protein [Acinetobacter terrae]NNH86671.1 hypothetical protein [Acinetobacter terrae]
MNNTNFDKYHPEIDNWFNFYFKESNLKSDCLIVVLSPSTGFMLKNYDLMHDALYISEKTNSYYTFSIDILSDVISNFLNDLDKTVVVYVGSSKSGFGAINLGRMQPKLNKLQKSFSLSFSPVTRVYPLDKPHPYKTYTGFIKKIESNALFKQSAEKFGLLTKAPNLENYKEVIYVGAYSSYDIQELSYLLSVSQKAYKFIDVNLVPTQSHNITALFAFANLPFDDFISRCLIASENDHELQWTKADSDMLIQNANKIFESVKNKTIPHIIEGILQD